MCGAVEKRSSGEKQVTAPGDSLFVHSLGKRKQGFQSIIVYSSILCSVISCVSCGCLHFARGCVACLYVEQ